MYESANEPVQNHWQATYMNQRRTRTKDEVKRALEAQVSSDPVWLYVATTQKIKNERRYLQKIGENDFKKF